MKPIKILIADDQMLMRDALKTILEVQEDFLITGVAENGLQVIQMTEIQNPDVILLDIRMPIMNGVECIRILKQKYPQIKVIMLTTFNDEEYITDALTCGANGYILKDIEVSKLTGIIRDVMDGKMIMPMEVASKLSESLSKLRRKPGNHREINLTDREKEVVDMLVKGFTNSQIALSMYISEGTVRNYISSIYNKIGISDRTQAAIFLKENFI